MASHFSTIGIKLEDQSDYVECLKQVNSRGESIRSKNGTYIKWSIDSKIELWAQLNRKNEAIGMNPHFFGSSEIEVKLDSRVNDPDNNELDGAFYANFCSNDIPFVFDVPNMDIMNDIEMPQTVTIQLAAFAHEIKVFESDQAYTDSQQGEPKFASESFIPSGLFRPDGEQNIAPKPYSIFSGHILDFSVNTNSYAKLDYYWIKASVLGCEIDVLADINLLDEKPNIGGVVSGSFWLTGKVLSNYKKKRKSLVDGLFKRK